MKTSQVRRTIINKVCTELNEMECRPPIKHVYITVEVKPNLADDPLVVGERYSHDNLLCSWSNYLGQLTSGILILGLKDGTSTAKYIRENKSTRAYRIKGVFGLATEDYSKDGRAIHQKKMFELCGVDIQSQTAYELATQGLMRPATSKTPLIYGIRCIDFKLPEFTIEIQCINEYEMYLKSLIHDIVAYNIKKMTTDSDLKVLISSQDLRAILDEDLQLNTFVNDNMNILDDVEEVIPEQYDDVPSSEDYSGPYNFDTFIDPSGNKNWMFSAMLNKVYIINHSNFSVDFKWDFPNDKIEFYVRAMPIYASPQDAHKPVTCCIQHSQSTERYNAGLPKLQRQHILRSISQHARYTGGADRHLSVVLPLGNPQTGMETVRHTFNFVCKNSCVTGINRRAVDLIFTLEDIEGNIYGRRKIGVRVCSCPKRDKTKEEEEYKKYHGQPGPKSKRRKIVSTKKLSFTDPNDVGLYSINLEVCGKKNAKAIITYARNLMASEVIDRNNDEPFRSCFNELTNTLKSYE
ncbi:P53 DNA-binding domain [Popillia japonica]|uniref:P53 DNA-binding domain n=1 Tax=Popillia japonica TaxID=7064 RepID=A0AAW1N2C4_POPJA